MTRFLKLCLAFWFTGCAQAQHPVRPVNDLVCTLGEGAIWNPHTSELAFIDIEKGLFFRYNPLSDSLIRYSIGSKTGTVVPVAPVGGYALATQQGIIYISENSQPITLVHPETNPQIRYNDGKCDPSGRFYVGTMALNGQKGSGTLFVIDSALRYKPVIQGVSISNGIVWNADGQLLYYIDTPTRKVTEYRVNQSDGTLTYIRDAITIPDSLGHPDGSTIDSKGNIWIAMWGGASVTCWDPVTGELKQLIPVPAKNVTSCAFGGPNLSTLYITTASVGMNEADWQRYPDAGKVFYTTTDAVGIAANAWKVLTKVVTKP